MRHTFWLLGGAFLLVAAACSGGGSHHQAKAPTTTTTVATTTTETTVPPPTTTSTTIPDPAVVPTVIDANYVDAVLAQLNHVYGNAVRIELSTNDIPPQVIADVRAIFNDPEYDAELKIFSTALLQPLAFVRHPPGDRRTTVLQLMSASSSCIFAETATDYSAVDITTIPDTGTEYFELTPKQSGKDPESLNQTAWAIQKSESFLTPTTAPNPCVS